MLCYKLLSYNSDQEGSGGAAPGARRPIILIQKLPKTTNPSKEVSTI